MEFDEQNRKDCIALDDSWNKCLCPLALLHLHDGECLSLSLFRMPAGHHREKKKEKTNDQESGINSHASKHWVTRFLYSFLYVPCVDIEWWWSLPLSCIAIIVVVVGSRFHDARSLWTIYPCLQGTVFYLCVSSNDHRRSRTLSRFIDQQRTMTCRFLVYNDADGSCLWSSCGRDHGSHFSEWHLLCRAH